MLDEFVEYALALRMLRVDRDRTLVVIEHGEVERIRALHVDQLAARDVADTGTLHLDDVRAEPRQQLRAGRAGLDVREIENLDAVERLAVLAVGLVRHFRRAGLGRTRLLHGLFGGRLCSLLRNFLGRLARYGFRLHGLLRFLFGFLCHVSISPETKPCVEHANRATRPAVELFLLQCALRIEIADAAALAAGGRVEHGIDERRFA